MLTRWKEAEPVRLYLYGLLLALIALAVGYGLVTAELAPLWIALVTAAVLAPGVERARGSVTPYPGPRRRGTTIPRQRRS